MSLFSFTMEQKMQKSVARNEELQFVYLKKDVLITMSDAMFYIKKSIYMNRNWADKLHHFSINNITFSLYFLQEILHRNNNKDFH